MEIFSVLVAFSIFIIAWNTRQLQGNHLYLFLAIAYLLVGSLDLLHTLAYKGMAVFKDQGGNLATQLWIAGHYLESISLFCVPLFL
ncbi:MAG: MASE3 domain-containing protein [Thermodesulfobacteriota bacterium]